MTIPENAIISAMEYASLMLLVCRTADVNLFIHWRPLLFYAPIYIVLAVATNYMNFYVVMFLLLTSLIVFIKIVFCKRLAKTILICIISVFMSLVVFQMLFTVALGMLLSGPVEYTFRNGVTIMSVVIALSILCYMSIPLNEIMNALKNRNKDLRLVIAAILLSSLSVIFVSNTIYVEGLSGLTGVADYFLHIGFSVIIIAACYSAMKFILDRNEKKRALKRFEELKELPVSYGMQTDEFEAHLQNIRMLAILCINDYDKLLWYLKTYMNSCGDTETDADIRNELWKFDNKVLATYLYAKMKHLHSQGYACTLNIYNHSYISKLSTSKLLEALDILIDEALETTYKERCELTINVARDPGSGMSFIDIVNKNELISIDIARSMVLYKYSFKTKKAGGLRKLSLILDEYDCGFTLRNEKSPRTGQKYLNFRFVL